MKISFRLESTAIRYAELSTIFSKIENSTNNIISKHEYWYDENLLNYLIVIVRFYPKTIIEKAKEGFVNKAKYSKKEKCLYVWHNFSLEEIEDNNPQDIFLILKDCLIKSIIEIKNKKISGIEIEKMKIDILNDL